MRALALLHGLLRRLDPERAHNVVLALLGLAERFTPVRRALARWFAVEAAPVRLWGRTFRHPVGLAAGYDKDARAWRALGALGFAFVEVGTVTLYPQAGNPRPRVVRVPEARALVNWMGFPSRGADFVARQLARPREGSLVLGVNLGRHRATSNEQAADEYARLAGRFVSVADFLTLNVSSPNTPGLRDLQTYEALLGLLRRVRRVVDRAPAPRPALLLKVSPDLDWPELDRVLQAAEEAGVDGIIATNTTVDKRGLPPRYRHLPGGVSGAPLRERSTQVIAYIHRVTQGRMPIIGVGGILTPEDALEKAEAGAQLVQLFTGWVYRGPPLVADILRRWRSAGV